MVNAVTRDVGAIPYKSMGMNMNTAKTFATDRFRRGMQFVVVNHRVPNTNQHCVLCSGLLEKGYVRDVQTRLIYCDPQCFTAWANEAARVAKGLGRKAS